ncbi:putative transmembrane protein [Toxoplasma gondii VAND]|uniref:Putative transmembrane protein n=1 Tax=Toxoplasma gondii VAND TaxID=933077 RepID=A0A086PJB9_TOXGO|nr:putative transmembrane protein [Toxoplasma gondii VAND]
MKAMQSPAACLYRQLHQVKVLRAPVHAVTRDVFLFLRMAGREDTLEKRQQLLDVCMHRFPLDARPFRPPGGLFASSRRKLFLRLSSRLLVVCLLACVLLSVVLRTSAARTCMRSRCRLSPLFRLDGSRDFFPSLSLDEEPRSLQWPGLPPPAHSKTRVTLPPGKSFSRTNEVALFTLHNASRQTLLRETLPLVVAPERRQRSLVGPGGSAGRSASVSFLGCFSRRQVSPSLASSCERRKPLEGARSLTTVDAGQPRLVSQSVSSIPRSASLSPAVRPTSGGLPCVLRTPRTQAGSSSFLPPARLVSASLRLPLSCSGPWSPSRKLEAVENNRTPEETEARPCDERKSLKETRENHQQGEGGEDGDDSERLRLSGEYVFSLLCIFGRLAEHAGLHSWGFAANPRLEYRHLHPSHSLSLLSSAPQVNHSSTASSSSSSSSSSSCSSAAPSDAFVSYLDRLCRLGREGPGSHHRRLAAEAALFLRDFSLERRDATDGAEKKEPRGSVDERDREEAGKGDRDEGGERDVDERGEDQTVIGGRQDREDERGTGGERREERIRRSGRDEERRDWQDEGGAEKGHYYVRGPWYRLLKMKLLLVGFLRYRLRFGPTLAPFAAAGLLRQRRGGQGTRGRRAEEDWPSSVSSSFLHPPLSLPSSSLSSFTLPSSSSPSSSSLSSRSAGSRVRSGVAPGGSTGEEARQRRSETEAESDRPDEIFDWALPRGIPQRVKDALFREEALRTSLPWEWIHPQIVRTAGEIVCLGTERLRGSEALLLLLAKTCEPCGAAELSQRREQKESLENVCPSSSSLSLASPLPLSASQVSTVAREAPAGPSSSSISAFFATSRSALGRHASAAAPLLLEPLPLPLPQGKKDRERQKEELQLLQRLQQLRLSVRDFSVLLPHLPFQFPFEVFEEKASEEEMKNFCFNLLRKRLLRAELHLRAADSAEAEGAAHGADRTLAARGHRGNAAEGDAASLESKTEALPLLQRPRQPGGEDQQASLTRDSRGASQEAEGRREDAEEARREEPMRKETQGQAGASAREDTLLADRQNVQRRRSLLGPLPLFNLFVQLLRYSTSSDLSPGSSLSSSSSSGSSSPSPSSSPPSSSPSSSSLSSSPGVVPADGRASAGASVDSFSRRCYARVADFLIEQELQRKANWQDAWVALLNAAVQRFSLSSRASRLAVQDVFQWLRGPQRGCQKPLDSLFLSEDEGIPPPPPPGSHTSLCAYLFGKGLAGLPPQRQTRETAAPSSLDEASRDNAESELETPGEKSGESKCIGLERGELHGPANVEGRESSKGEDWITFDSVQAMIFDAVQGEEEQSLLWPEFLRSVRRTQKRIAEAEQKRND